METATGFKPISSIFSHLTEEHTAHLPTSGTNSTIFASDSSTKKPGLTLLSDDSRGKAVFLGLLRDVFTVSNLYGKTNQQFEAIGRMFLAKLGRFPAVDVMQALNAFTDRNGNFPTPADLITLLEPDEEPLSPTMYIELKRRMRSMNEYVTPEERQFVKRYENQELGKVRGGTEEYREAQRQLEKYEY